MVYFKKISYSVFSILLVFLLNSCSKESSEKISTTAENQNLEVTDVPEEDVAEKDEDLLTVDYKIFYDELAPHGEWIEVTGNEIGLDLKKESGSGTNLNSSKRKISLSEFFGVKDAHAADMEFGSFFVWRPSANLSISVSSGSAPAYVPYSNGQWVYSSYGWYFKAPSAHEEIVHHYGRWVHSPAMGWIWVPGRVWAPAWVEWREDDVNIAWTPIPPTFYIVADEIPIVPVYEDNYVIVEKKYFVEPVIYNYFYKDKEYKKLVKSMRRPKGVVVVNNVIINQGPAILAIEKIRGSNIPVIKIHKVGNIKEVQITSSDINAYAPKFRKIKSKENLTYNHFQPRKYTKYDETSLSPKERKLESASNRDNLDKDNQNDYLGDKKGNGKKRTEFQRNENNKKSFKLNKKNKDNQRKNNIIKENKKSRNKEKYRNNNGGEKHERKNNNKKKRSYYKDENNYNLVNTRNGLT